MEIGGDTGDFGERMARSGGWIPIVLERRERYDQIPLILAVILALIMTGDGSGITGNSNCKGARVWRP